MPNLDVDAVCTETFLLRRPRRHGSRWRRPPTSFVDMEKAGLLNSKPRLWLRRWLDLWQTSLLCVGIGNELYLDHSMFCVLRQLWFGNITICNISAGAIIAFDPRKWKRLLFVGTPVRILFRFVWSQLWPSLEEMDSLHAALRACECTGSRGNPAKLT